VSTFGLTRKLLPLVLLGATVIRLPARSHLGRQSIATFWPKEDTNFETPCLRGEAAQRGVGLEKSWLKLKAKRMLQKMAKNRRHAPDTKLPIEKPP
jgi:hypothetical protein